MYEVKKRLEISAAHRLALGYESKCTNLHGHNWIIDVYLRSKELNEDGMVMDFTHIKKAVQEGASQMPAYVVKDGGLKEFTIKLGALTEDERKIITDGCLINFYRN